eukprot:TRINITY_DN60854_c0_g1_i3.p2 TRINITY_DN60854_c0_g1~~TRINITY_DN60854_c0_g1_i3.p2  ORF type:complete len:107 (+),score=37.76 TRINITY_DN60854_c0_g1_i3:105-425(+)
MCIRDSINAEYGGACRVVHSMENSPWTSEQQQALEQALLQFPSSLPQRERWNAIADAVPQKTRAQCVQRVKAIAKHLKNQPGNQQLSSPSNPVSYTHLTLPTKRIV